MELNDLYSELESMQDNIIDLNNAEMITTDEIFEKLIFIDESLSLVMSKIKIYNKDNLEYRTIKQKKDKLLLAELNTKRGA